MSIPAALAAILFALVPGRPLATQGQRDGIGIDPMDELHFRPTSEKATVASVDGRTGKAVRFAFDADGRGVFCASGIHGTSEWDKAAGISFWLKGDGSNAFGGLELIWNEDYGVRYDYVFPLKDTEWHRVTIAWHDLVPVLPGPNSRPLGTAAGNAPSKVSGLWFGRWWYWGDYPAHSFTVDDIRLETRILPDTRDFRPAGAPLGRVLAKLRAGKPVTIVTMGDSLTDTRHWSNRPNSWPADLRDALQAKYRSQITIVNPAIGGTQLRQNVVLIPSWLPKAPEPDLVTVFFGGNDWESGMRGPQFEQACADAVDRVRRATRGKADVLLMTTAPSVEQWTTHTELAEACRTAARTRRAGLADVESAFLKAGAQSKESLFAWDKVHLGRDGQKLTARIVLEAIERGGR